MLNQRLQADLDKRKELFTFRELSCVENLVDFTSNDFLGFAKNPDLINRGQNLLHTRSHGSTGSRLLTGNSREVESLEKKIASYHHREASLIYPSGYMANMGLLSCLPKEHDTILFDTHVHASIHDGLRLSKARSLPFRHNDSKHLERRLLTATGTLFVVVESVYSMDGSTAPLIDISEACRKHGAHLIVDEAHATGVYGPKGEGLVSELIPNEPLLASIHTFGKAMGSHGAAVITTSLVKNYLCNFSNSFIYTTALPYSTLCMIESAYDLLELTYSTHKQQISSLVTTFRSLLKNSPFPLSPNKGPIQSIVIGNPATAKTLSKGLKLHGFDVRAVVTPTVPRKHELLRITLHSDNTLEECSNLCHTLINLFQTDQGGT